MGAGEQYATPIYEEYQRSKVSYILHNERNKRTQRAQCGLTTGTEKTQQHRARHYYCRAHFSQVSAADHSIYTAPGARALALGWRRRVWSTRNVKIILLVNNWGFPPE